MLRKEKGKDIKNEAYIIGKIIGEGGVGSHAGVEQVLVLVEDSRVTGKKCHGFVILPVCESTQKLIDKGSIIKATGILTASYTFNSMETKHVFIQPTSVEELEDYKLEEDPQFHLNYTLYNRIILEGEISNVPTHREIESVGRGLIKFKFKFKGDGGVYKTVNCTLWDTVNEIHGLKKGSKIKMIASLNTTNRKTLKKEVIEGEKDYTTYNLLIQKVFDLGNSPEKLAEDIYGKK